MRKIWHHLAHRGNGQLPMGWGCPCCDRERYRGMLQAIDHGYTTHEAVSQVLRESQEQKGIWS